MNKPAEPTAHPQPPAGGNFNLAVEAVQGGVRITFVYPFLMSQVIIPEAHVSRLANELLEKLKETPRVIIPG